MKYTLHNTTREMKRVNIRVTPVEGGLYAGIKETRKGVAPFGSIEWECAVVAVGIGVVQLPVVSVDGIEEGGVWFVKEAFK